MNHYVRLFEFICELIDIQIKKYKGLATFGVGPDAQLNAHLVYEEVNELLHFAEVMLNNAGEVTLYDSIFNQVKFYIEQEYKRGQAAMLLDENNIHNKLDARVIQQLNELKEIAQSTGIEFKTKSEPVTIVQCQCEHDSAQIAFYILDLAVKIRENPLIEIDNKVPEHAQKILRKHATGRYVKLAEEIDKLHIECETYLKSSSLITSSLLLSKETAKVQESIQKNKFKKILQRYQTQVPDSKLFSPEHEWYKVGVSANINKPASSLFSSKNLTLFGSAALVAGMLVCKLLPYFSTLLDETASPTSTLD